MLNLSPIDSRDFSDLEPCQMGNGRDAVKNGTVKAASPENRAYAQNIKESRANGRGISSSIASRKIMGGDGKAISSANVASAVTGAVRAMQAGGTSLGALKEGATQTIKQSRSVNSQIGRKGRATKARKAAGLTTYNEPVGPIGRTNYGRKSVGPKAPKAKKQKAAA
jgi:hypothetical protein